MSERKVMDMITTGSGSDHDLLILLIQKVDLITDTIGEFKKEMNEFKHDHEARLRRLEQLSFKQIGAYGAITAVICVGIKLLWK